ncbi:MAG: hypothetical protein ACFCU4_02455 [Puniceicoccaceae bacterium]
MQLERYYENVLDLPSVNGLLVVRKSGEVAYDRLPSFIPRETLGDIVRRITALYDTVDENFLPCDDYVFKYPEKWLVFRRNKDAIIMLMVDPEVNFVSLKMVCNLALKNTDVPGLKSLEAGVAPRANSPQPPPSTGDSASNSVTAAPAPASGEDPLNLPAKRVIRRPSRTYRGTSY